MAFRNYILVLYGSALLIQAIAAQNSEALYNIGPSYNTVENARSLGGNGFNLANAASGLSSNFAGNGIGVAGNIGLSNGLRVNGVGASNGFSSRLGNQGSSLSNGGGFQVFSTSPSAPTGISTVTELNLEGPLTIAGSLPLLATISLEGQLPTNGQASATYSCGNSDIGITSQLDNGSPTYGTGSGLAKSLGLPGSARY